MVVSSQVVSKYDHYLILTTIKELVGGENICLFLYYLYI